MREQLEALAASLRKHSFWIGLAAASTLVVVVSVWVGVAALARAEAWHVRANDLDRTRHVAVQWTREFEPATPAEAGLWQESEQAVRARGIAAADRIAIVQLVAQRAEELGLADVSVGFTASDTLRAIGGREVEGDSFELAPYAVTVRFLGEYGSVARYVAALPPQVEVHSLDLYRTPDGLEASLVLVVYVRTGGGGVDAASP